MKLNTTEIKKFKIVSDSIKSRNILPILNYLKFDNGTITKSNGESFVVMDADFEGSFLVDESQLMSFIEKVNSKEIEIEVEGKRLLLINPNKKQERMASPTEPVENFLNVAETGGEEIEFDDELIEQIKTASAFTTERENLPYTSCVFLGNGIVGAVNGFIAYAKKIEVDVPKIVLEKNVTDAIKRFKNG